MIYISFSMKKIKLIITFGIFGLAFICHFMYDFIPIEFFKIFFPVNESIWEHMKLLVTPVLIGSLFEYIYYIRKGIKVNNFILGYTISIIIGIILYLGIYLPIHMTIGHNAIIAIGLLLVVYFVMELISYYFITRNKVNCGNYIGIILIILIYGICYYLTNHPGDSMIFYDKNIK